MFTYVNYKINGLVFLELSVLVILILRQWIQFQSFRAKLSFCSSVKFASLETR